MTGKMFVWTGRHIFCAEHVRLSHGIALAGTFYHKGILIFVGRLMIVSSGVCSVFLDFVDLAMVSTIYSLKEVSY